MHHDCCRDLLRCFLMNMLRMELFGQSSCSTSICQTSRTRGKLVCHRQHSSFFETLQAIEKNNMTFADYVSNRIHGRRGEMLPLRNSLLWSLVTVGLNLYLLPVTNISVNRSYYGSSRGGARIYTIVIFAIFLMGGEWTNYEMLFFLGQKFFF